MVSDHLWHQHKRYTICYFFFNCLAKKLQEVMQKYSMPLSILIPHVHEPHVGLQPLC